MNIAKKKKHLDEKNACTTNRLDPSLNFSFEFEINPNEINRIGRGKSIRFRNFVDGELVISGSIRSPDNFPTRQTSKLGQRVSRHPEFSPVTLSNCPYSSSSRPTIETLETSSSKRPTTVPIISSYSIEGRGEKKRKKKKRSSGCEYAIHRC